jgi:adenylylsulfate kinase
MMTNLTYHSQSISLAEREARNGHKAAVLWFTGLSGSGKSTLAMALQDELFHSGRQVVVLDGDNIRQGLNAGLGFSAADRVENLRRVAEVSRRFAENGNIVLTSFISPFQKERDQARRIVAPLPFYEIHVHVELVQAEDRDPKGLYKKARAGELQDFTGIDSPYEVPAHPDLKISNGEQDVAAGVTQLMTFLQNQHIL